MRIGLLADTHMPGSLRNLWPQVFTAFDGVDCILHAGDLHTLAIVDRLSELAPTYVARGNGDRGLEDERLRDTWMLNLAGITVGMIHRLPSPERQSTAQIHGYVERYFGGDVPQVLIYGHTHMEAVDQVGGLLCVNPGSPTLPRSQTVRLGTIGFLELGGRTVTASIHQLTETGTKPHPAIQPVQTKFNGYEPRQELS